MENFNSIDEKYMQRCLELAANALGNTYPNPLVGSVIVYDNQIIGEGYHTKAGKPHAEIEAINSVKNKELLSKSTLYVNLEPCSHYGKTPPCAIKIAELKIPRVVIGTIDTTDKVAGKGIEILRKAGIDVKTGILENQSRLINKRFFTFHEKKRPFIILKWAQTTDGFIDKIRQTNATKEPTLITTGFEKNLLHKWRTEEQSIMVGTTTAFNDNPQLNTRFWYGNNPIRITIDKNLKLPKSMHFFDKQVPTIVFNYIKNEQVSDNLKFVKIDINDFSNQQILNYLYTQNIQSLIVEGGQTLLYSFIDNNLWDEARIFIAKKMFYEGLEAPKLKNYQLHEYERVGESNLLIFKNKEQ